MDNKEDDICFYRPAIPKNMMAKIEITKHLLNGEKVKNVAAAFNLSTTTIRHAPLKICRSFGIVFRNKFLYEENFDALVFFRSDFGISSLQKYEDYLTSLTNASSIAYPGTKSHQSLLEDRVRRVKIRLNKRRDLQIKMINDECDSLIRAIDEIIEMTQ